MIRKIDDGQLCDEGAYLPSQEEIAAETAKIRLNWSEHKRNQRAFFTTRRVETPTVDDSKVSQ